MPLPPRFPGQTVVFAAMILAGGYAAVAIGDMPAPSDSTPTLGGKESAAAAPAATAAAPAEVGGGKKVDFGREIQPIFARRCFSCHGPDEAKAGLRLDRKEAAFGELESGEKAIVAGKPAASALLRRITAEDESERMPPEGKPLTPAETRLVRRWIDEGAAWDDHWAFRPRSEAVPPPVKNAAWGRTPVDAFILHSLEQRGLSPAPAADKIALLRRATYSVTGLPPTLAEIDDFLADSSPEAFEKVVDRLLASPRYGEHWARHWLDVVRYADTNSFERDGPKPNAWRFRDYVIRSFNDDKPYDQFVREQLAGDELSPATPDSIIATGFYRLGLWDDEPADELQARYDELDDIVSTTAQAFLGLTVNCARCHDHKIDPIPQRDYYSLLAFFHELRPYGNRSEQEAWNQRDISTPQLAAQYAELDASKRAVRDEMTGIEQRGILKMSAQDQRKTEGAEREAVLKEKLASTLSEEDRRRYDELQKRKGELESTELPPRVRALSVHSFERPPETFILERGSPHAQGAKVEPAFPSLFAAAPPALSAVEPPAGEPSSGGGSEGGGAGGRRSSGRRLALANWIASPENRLTARVMVNRVWQHHFGRGIVRSTNNFGQIGDRPTHPELLDWLAGELIRNGWRLKPLHKALLLSSAYQMSSQANAAGLKADPSNDLYWRFDMRRLSAEELRDSIHAASGHLNLEMYGPGVYPEISAEVLAGQSVPGKGWGNSPPEQQARRSIYIHVKRSLITPILADFDFPDTDSSCAARFATTQPTQALGMMNGEFMQRQAAALAVRLRREAGTDLRRQITLALRLATGRAPDEASVERNLALLDTLEKKHGQSASKALDLFCLTTLNLNEFVFLD